MTTQYPSTLPQPLVSGFSFAVASGVVRGEMETHQAQRRVHNTMPHEFSMSFIMDFSQWSTWLVWVTTYGYRWFEIELPSMYAGQLGQGKSPVLVRLKSTNLSAASVSLDSVQISVVAEMAPSMIAAYLEDVP
jgi:hypothetical protein